MVAKLLDGKALATKHKELIIGRVDTLKENGITPNLAIVMVGGDPASKVYVNNKINFCSDVGAKATLHSLDTKVSSQEVIDTIYKLNQEESVHGIILQMPLPKGLNFEEMVSRIDPKKDVDGLHPLNLGLVAINAGAFIPATAKGVLALLDEYKIDVTGKTVVIVGHGIVSGMPLNLLLNHKKATVIICQNETKNLKEYTLQADILISAVGKPGLITSNMVKEGAAVIDIGISKKGSEFVGDVEKEVETVAKYITPVPGGVGPLTVSSLVDNLVIATEYFSAAYE
ncbi:MAG: bifunctional 5,10-methylenetetrahydrofolate dehydrogenase/5,10-methenyltetrahydrofolate cyclohydrolase [Patescibacteria group bacterium]|nr:bifunctional 5,10-methylenetetrahydrofolate dehydrogenase/5,10-methenyltetrahydrofolate cyclohydrolase [Patescibacteria group bacterium]